MVKHFPGLGSVDGDSHVSLPVQASSLEELKARDLRPFVAAIEAGAPVVMTGHVDVQALDPGVPASLSPEVVQGLLRDRLGLRGGGGHRLAGDGAGLRDGTAPGEGAVLSLLAGNDLVLNSPEPAAGPRGGAAGGGRGPASGGAARRGRDAGAGAADLPAAAVADGRLSARRGDG